MGKVIKGVGKVLGAVASVAAVIPGPWQPIAAIVAVGASVAVGLTQGKPQVPQSDTHLDRLTARLDTQAARKLVLSTTAMPADIRYYEGSGKDDEYIDYILVVAAHRVRSIDKIWFEDALAWTATGGVQGEYVGYLADVTVRTEGTAANTIAINGGTRWGADDRLTGCAYVRLRIKRTGKTDKEQSPLVSGLPGRVTIIGEGMPMYDPRFDSTVGGEGSMRIDDQSTWGASSGNLIIQALNVLLGWRINGKLSVGGGLPPKYINLDSAITAANICDEDIALSSGGSQKRYRGAGAFSTKDAPMDIVAALLAGCAGELLDCDGQLSFLIKTNTLATPAVTFDDHDVLSAASWDPMGGKTNVPNIVAGSFTDPSALYQMVPFPSVSLPSEDGIDRVEPIDFAVVEDSARAERLTKQTLQRMQYCGTFSAEYNMKGMAATIGAIVWQTYSPLGWVNKPFRVVSQKPSRSGRIALVLREENEAIYAWEAEDSASVQAAEPVRFDPLNSGPILLARLAGKTAEWPGVSDPDGTKPEDGATVGAPNGTPVGTKNAEDVLADIEQTKSDIGDLVQTYGSTAAAAASADAAEGYAHTASDAAAVTGQAKLDAQQAQDAAEDARDTATAAATSAGSSKTAAAGSASTATSKASEAKQSAAAAAGSATAASTKAGDASTSAVNAATSATNAKGSENAAASSARVAATAYTGARQLSRPVYAENKIFTGYQSGSPDTVGTLPVTSMGGGNSISLPSQSTKLLPVAPYSFKGGHSYRIRVLGEKAGDGAHPRLIGGIWILDNSYTAIASAYSSSTNVSWNEPDWIEFGVTLPEAVSNAVWIRPGVMRMDDADASYAALLSYALQIEDVTESEAAKAAAAASASSASTASVKAGEASQFSSAAQASANTASTKAGQASTSADSAATSESNALGSKNQAATSAQNAAQSASQAGVSASSAAGSASTASSKAGEASQSASAALASQVSASVAADATTKTATNQHPTTFEQQGLFFSGFVTNATPEPTGVSFNQDGPNGAWAARNSSPTSYGLLGWKSCVPAKHSLWKIRALVGNSNGAASGVILRIAEYSEREVGSGYRQGYHDVACPTPANGFVWVEAVIDTRGANIEDAPWFRPEIILHNGEYATDNGTYVRCAALELQDVTSEANAAGSADAAASSASSASASKTAAGNSATSATTAKNAAEAANTNAQSAASSASGSAATANSAASQASTSASNSATYRDQSKDYRDTAQGHASTATSQAAVATAQASAAQSSAVLSARLAQQGYFPNGNFAQWTSGSLPDGVQSWYSPDYEKVSNGFMGSPNGLRIKTQGGANGGALIDTPIVGDWQTGQYVVATVAISPQSSRDMRGAGILFRPHSSDGATDGGYKLDLYTTPDTAGVTGNGSAGKTRIWQVLLRSNAALSSAAQSMRLYLMNTWTGIPSYSSGKGDTDLVWLNANVRPATQAEIDSGKIAGLEASVAQNAGVLAEHSGKLSAYWNVTANAGSASAVIAAKADGTESTVAMAASKVVIANPSNNGDLRDAVVFENGEATMAAARIRKVTSGLLQNAAGTHKIDLDAGQIVFNTGSVMKVTGIGFGTANQFIEWIGPPCAISQCDEASAVQYVKVDGSAYFGGSLSAGTTKNAVGTSSIAEDASVSTDLLGSRGGTRSVTLSYSWSHMRTLPPGTYPVSHSGGTSAVIAIYRNGQYWNSLTVSGNVTEEIPNGADPGRMFESMGGSITLNDTSGGTSVRYSAAITSRDVATFTSSSGSDHLQQYVGIVQTEQ